VLKPKLEIELGAPKLGIGIGAQAEGSVLNKLNNGHAPAIKTNIAIAQ
jgi:hypothetical protein